jgi:hypothetical protein
MTRETDDARLDALLDALAPPRATLELTARILATAPTPRRSRGWIGWLLPAGLGAGLAAAGAAGVIAGVQIAHAQSASTEATIAAIAGEDAQSAYTEDAA